MDREGSGGDDLATAVARSMFPTPRASDGERGGRGDLIQAVRGNENKHFKMYPTPAARDYRFPNAKTFAERGGGKKGEQLPNAVGGALNPEWVEWLQGFPVGWTDCEPSETP
jgi:DNA (cytosine-5)-methyltransferase 1